MIDDGCSVTHNCAVLYTVQYTVRAILSLQSISDPSIDSIHSEASASDFYPTFSHNETPPSCQTSQIATRFDIECRRSYICYERNLAKDEELQSVNE